MFPSPGSRLRIWSRETGSAVPSRVSLLISILRQNLVLTGFLTSSAVASIYLFKLSYAIGSVPSLPGHAIAYRWRSLPRVRRNKASRSQDSSSNGVTFAGHREPINVRLPFPTAVLCTSFDMPHVKKKTVAALLRQHTGVVPAMGDLRLFPSLVSSSNGMSKVD